MQQSRNCGDLCVGGEEERGKEKEREVTVQACMTNCQGNTDIIA